MKRRLRRQTKLFSRSYLVALVPAYGGNSPGVLGARFNLERLWRLQADSPGSFALIWRCIRLRVQVDNAVVFLGSGRMQCIQQAHDDRD